MTLRWWRTRRSTTRWMRIRRAIALLGGVITFGVRAAAAQQGLQFTHLSTDEGISAAWVTSVYQDSRGFMWFGTHNGLDRYDASSVVTFRHERGDSSSLSDNYIYFITEDADSVLWIGTREGLSRFDRERNVFRNIVVGDGTATTAAISMLQTRRGMIVVGITGALLRFDPATGTSTPYFPQGNAAFAGRPVMSLLEDHRGHIWIGTEGAGLFDLDPVAGVMKSYTGTPSNPRGFPDDDIRGVVEDARHMIWAATFHGGLVRIDPQTGTLTRFRHDPRNSRGLAHDALQALALNDTTGLWIGLDNGGIDHLDFKTGVITHNPFDPNDAMGLNNSGSIWALFEDNAGTLWAGTFTGGVNMARRNSDAIRLYRSVPGDSSSLSANTVMAFAQDSAGAIWIATDGAGLNRLDPTTKRFTRFTAKNGGVNRDIVLAVAAEPNGDIWIGTWGGGISRLNPRTKTYTAYTTKNTNIPDDNIFGLLLDRAGRLWVGSWRDGLLLFHPNTRSFTAYSVRSTETQQSQVWIIHELHDGRLALGTLQQGMRIFDPRTKAMTVYRTNVKDRNSLASDEIRAIREGAPGILWIGTSGGLDRLDLRTNTFTHFSASDGILASAVSGIAIDDRGDLWLSTDQGITRFNAGTRTSSRYSMADGLQGRDFTARAYLQGRDNTLVFGGNAGFNIIQPASLVRNARIPPVVITGFKLFNKPVVIGARGSPLVQDISMTRELTLSYLQSVFSFEFSALDYTAPAKNQYQYMLEGVDRDWTPPSLQRSVTYTGLPPRHYVFRVRGSNNDGVWNDAGASVRLTITPPFWRTPWFLTLVALLITACVAAIVRNARRRHQYLKRVNVRLAEAAEHDRQSQQYLEGNVHDILNAMQKFSEGDYSVALRVESTDAIGDLRGGFNTLVADLKRAEEELRHAQKMEAVGELAGGVAHDFNNLLTVIVGNTSLAIEEAVAEGRAAGELMEIERAAVRASALTRQLLAFSRKQILHPREFSLNDVANELGNMLGRTLGEEIELQIVTDPSLARVRADPGQIELVLMNLVMNARDAMPRQGSLLIQTRNVPAKEGSEHPDSDGGDYVELMVRDSGTGMSDEVKQRIFEPFFTTKEQGKGTGLGLSTVYGIVKQSGGYVIVTSEAGKGTSFCVRLPQVQAADAPARRSDSSPIVRGSATVLLVEDEDAVRGLASRILERGGYRVLTANCGDAALELAAHFEGTIDLLLTDVVMPGMSGRELAERLVPRRPGMRVMFASGYTEDAILRHGVSSEAVIFLPKPFTPDELLRTVQLAMESPAGLAEPAMSTRSRIV